jgi:hypothetical protein
MEPAKGETLMTAEETAIETASEIESLIEELQAKVASTNFKAANWSVVGTLGAIRESLRDTNELAGLQREIATASGSTMQDQIDRMSPSEFASFRRNND